MWVRNFHNMGASGTEALFIWDDRATEDGGLLRLIGVEIRHSIGGGEGCMWKKLGQSSLHVLKPLRKL